MTIQERLFALQDGDYGDFHSSLLPGFPRGYFIGIRVPVLRKFVKEYKKEEEAREFLTQLPHTYYEESMVHAFLIAEIKDYDTCIKQWKHFFLTSITGQSVMAFHRRCLRIISRNF